MVVTLLMINIPMLLFNCTVALPQFWFDNPLVIIVGVMLQLAITLIFLKAGTTDPGIIPATYLHPCVKRDMPRRYTKIMFKDHRVFY